jgi:hypothetical protein
VWVRAPCRSGRGVAGTSAGEPAAVASIRAADAEEEFEIRYSPSGIVVAEVPAPKRPARPKRVRGIPELRKGWRSGPNNLAAGFLAAINNWQGPAIVTSVKADVLDATVAAQRTVKRLATF